ncbi:MAG: 23S rRNA (adenine(2503)-C(2))-methyltransferase RlmN [Bacillota bacterium]
MESIYSYQKDELVEFLAKNYYPAFRATQVYNWLYKKRINDPIRMLNLPIGLRSLLKDSFFWYLPLIRKQQVSKLDATTKFLLEFADGKQVEAVLMYHMNKNNVKLRRTTVCISSQVGCPVGCTFCATGKMGFSRNLSAGELVGQVMVAIEHLGDKMDNVVFMGMGEPLLNYEHVMKSIRILIDDNGLNFSSRKITISTCGLVPEIKKLANEGLPITLAISLHAARNEIRSRIVPINRKYPLEQLLEAVKYFIATTNRKVTFEYVLIKDINDSAEDARLLAALLKNLLCNVNLIPTNPVHEGILHRPSLQTIENFVEVLKNVGIEAVVRAEKGTDIDAACGQLKIKSQLGK